VKILLLTTEMEPFASAGALGEAAASLPRALKMHGHEVRAIMPRYQMIRERKHGLRDIARFSAYTVEYGSGPVTVALKSGFSAEGHAQVYFIEQHNEFHREGIYGPPSGDTYDDNPRRFGFFLNAAFQVALELHWMPDIIHCLGASLAGAPIILRHSRRYSALSGVRIALHLPTSIAVEPFETTGAELGLEAAAAASRFTLPAAGIADADILFLDGVGESDPVIDVEGAAMASVVVSANSGLPSQGRDVRRRFNEVYAPVRAAGPAAP